MAHQTPHVRERMAGMSKANSGWVRKQTAVLLSATLALSPVLVVPAMAGETDGDAAPQEQTVENGEQNTDEGVEKDVEQTGEDSADATLDRGWRDGSRDGRDRERDGSRDGRGPGRDRERRRGERDSLCHPRRRRRGGQQERRHAHAAGERVREHLYLARGCESYGHPGRRVLGLADSCGELCRRWHVVYQPRLHRGWPGL